MKMPRDHHFIPAFYLKHWAGPDQKLVEYSLQRGRIYAKSVGPHATGYQTDLYAFPELPADCAQHLERVYFDYADRTADKALHLQLRDPTVGWTTELVSAWSRFIVGIHLRHPDAMPELRLGAAAILDQDSQANYEKIRQPDDPPTIDKYFAAKDPLVKYKMQLNLIIKALDNQFICQHINQMHWGVADLSGADSELLTSDRPVEIYALAKPKGFISLPMSPTKLFVAANDPEL